MKQPEPIRRLIDAFLILPGIGRRTAERFAFSLMQGRKEAAGELAGAIVQLHASITTCNVCGQFSEQSPCNICGDKSRDPSMLVVVSDSRNIFPIEHTNQYRGFYFVLGGVLDPIEGVNPSQLRLPELMARLKQETVKEIILAFNVDVSGDATTLYLKQLLKDIPVKITKLARGLPTGSQLEYADEITLGSALTGRREI